MKNVPYRIYLQENEIPKEWMNIQAVMKEKHDPFINPETMKPATREDFKRVFCDELVEQEFNHTDRLIEIPDEVYEYYKLYRPSPLVRAYNLEKELRTPAKIYYKFEGNNTSGSHKLNSAAAQVYYAKKQGVTSVTTETGAGQWGTALSMCCAHFGIDLTVYMVKVSFQQKPFRKAVIETFGADVIPSPSDTTNIGREILKMNPDTGGSLGCAISEAVEKASATPNCRYVLGSVLNQVILHQSVIGLESRTAMEKIDEYPDIIIGCAGGGSNAGGLFVPFLEDKILGKQNPHFILVEPSSCPSLTKGRYAYDYCDTGNITPIAKMYTLGSRYIPSPDHAGGLRFHGMSPILSKLYHDGIIDEAVTAKQTDIFKAATTFAKAESILPAPESSHAIYSAIEEAKKCRESGEAKTILFGLSGTGYFDMNAYSQFMRGEMHDSIPTDEEIELGLKTLPQIPQD